jgi:RimJ/RimL family protein N-acetyltransferase
MKEGPIPNNIGRFTFSIVPKGQETPIGAHVVKLFNYRSASMTVALHDREWRGKGVVLEVRPRLMNHFFRNGEVDRFIASINGRNMASIFNYRRLGFSHVGTLHRQYSDPVTGEIIDIVNFEIFRPEWERSSWAEEPHI